MPAVEVNLGKDPQLSGVLCTLVVGGPGSGGESLTVGACPSDLSPGLLMRDPNIFLVLRSMQGSAGGSSETRPIVMDYQQEEIVMLYLFKGLSLASNSPRRDAEDLI